MIKIRIPLYFANGAFITDNNIINKILHIIIDRPMNY